MRHVPEILGGHSLEQRLVSPLEMTQHLQMVEDHRHGPKISQGIKMLKNSGDGLKKETPDAQQRLDHIIHRI